MGYAIQWVRSLLFNIQMYLMMAVYALAFAPFAQFNRIYAYHGVHAYCRYVRWTASWMVGLKSEIRGTPPPGEVVIGAKHHNFLDIIMIVSAVPRPKFIMKSSLRYTPFLGWYAKRLECVPVDRGKRAEAMRGMVRAVKNGTATPGQLIIYPQGTRVAWNGYRKYKVGTFVLYKELNQPCVPVATNVGVFWARHGIYRHPGLAVVEFLDPIAPGQRQKPFMTELENVIEDRSKALMREAGFEPDELRH